VPVRETHVDAHGIAHHVDWLSRPDDDRDAILAARALTLAENLRLREIEAFFQDFRDMALRYATGAQVLAAWRERFRSAEREQAVRMAVWLLRVIETGRATETQVRQGLGLTLTQWTTLKTKLEDMKATWTKLQAARGE
jgi:hypothetical protein